MQERLQKIMAACGVASRRKAEEIIAAGRVTVNGAVVRELGTKADLVTDAICVDGAAIARPEKMLYFMMNKPKGYVTTVSDPEGRPTVVDIVGKTVGRVYPVGRLDFASEGLLVLTNDGALAERMMKAGSHMPKTYLVKISGKPDEKRIAQLRAGIVIELEDGRKVKTAPAKIRLFEDGENPWYEVVLIEGRNRQIRRMFEKVGHLVEKIRRVRMGPLILDLEPGRFRTLTGKEVELLKKAAGREGSKGTKGSRG
jgi:23S rRNA pseudouridine2605 synthase